MRVSSGKMNKDLDEGEMIQVQWNRKIPVWEGVIIKALQRSPGKQTFFKDWNWITLKPGTVKVIWKLMLQNTSYFTWLRVRNYTWSWEAIDWKEQSRRRLCGGTRWDLWENGNCTVQMYWPKSFRKRYGFVDKFHFINPKYFVKFFFMCFKG